MNEVDLKEFKQKLEDYHVDLIDVAFLSSHLLDLCLDDSDLPEWRLAACHLMRKRLVDVAEALPFPVISPQDAQGGKGTPLSGNQPPLTSSETIGFLVGDVG